MGSPQTPAMHYPPRLLFSLTFALVAAACGLPDREAAIPVERGVTLPLEGFDAIRAVDGYPNEGFQASLDRQAATLAKEPAGGDGRRSVNLLVLSSGGINGAFGAGILNGWTARGDRPRFDVVTGVSVGGLLAPFAFVGSEYDETIAEIFQRLVPSDLHEPKGTLSALYGESVMDNTPLRNKIDQIVDRALLEAVARRHDEGGRCYIGSTNIDTGEFIVWDMGKIASYGTSEALELFKKVLTASASIPVVYPPVRFAIDDRRDEMHVDGAAIRPLFLPLNVASTLTATRGAGVDLDRVDYNLYVLHNGSLQAERTKVARSTLEISTRAVYMMGYMLVSQHILDLYISARASGARFNFVAIPDGFELISASEFSADDTQKLFNLGLGMMESEDPWRHAPPGFIARKSIERLRPVPRGEAGLDEMEEFGPRAGGGASDIVTELRRLERSIRALQKDVHALRQAR